MTTKTLRYYQEEALDASLKHYLAGEMDQVIVLPTGCGKTVVFVNLPDHHGLTGRVLILTHTDELAQQAIDKIDQWLPHEQVGLEKASSYADEQRFVVASIQSMSQQSRLDRYPKDSFRTIICDEGHHSVSDQWQKVLKHFTGALVVKVTATPERGDKQALEGTLVYHYDIVQAIKDGYLAKPRGKRLMSGVNLDGVRAQGDDFNKKELNLAVNTPEANRKVTEFWIAEGENRKTVDFCTSVEHALAAVEEYRRQGVDARAIYGASRTRAKDLSEFENNEYKVAVTVMLLTEGWDCWDVSCVVMRRPIRSAGLYKQCLGRGLRIPPECSSLNEWFEQGREPRKKDCLILDVACVTSKHKLQSLPSIFGLPPKMDMHGSDVLDAINELMKVQATKPGVDLSECPDLTNLATFAEQVDLLNVKFPAATLEFSEFQWLDDGRGGFIIYLPNEESVKIEFCPGSGGYNVHGKVNGITFGKHEDTLYEAFFFADKTIKKHAVEFDSLRRQPNSKLSEPITEVQVRWLKAQLVRRSLPEPEWSRMTKFDGRKLFLKLAQMVQEEKGWIQRTNKVA